MSHSTAIPSSARVGSSFVATLGYVAGLACFVLAWWGNYTPLPAWSLTDTIVFPETALTDTSSFVVCLVGICLIAFGRSQCIRSGATAAHFFTVVACGAIGLGIWALALFEPATLFPRPLSGGMEFAAFLIGWLATAGASTAAKVMTGRKVED